MMNLISEILPELIWFEMSSCLSSKNRGKLCCVFVRLSGILMWLNLGERFCRGRKQGAGTTRGRGAIPLSSLRREAATLEWRTIRARSVL